MNGGALCRAVSGAVDRVIMRLLRPIALPAVHESPLSWRMMARTSTNSSVAQQDGNTAGFERVLPAYQQVADQLEGAILRGSLGPGDRLPTEIELASTFGVSRGTMREALRSLASRDLLYSVRGAGGGTFIAETNFDRISTYLETCVGLLSGSGVLSAVELYEMREILEVNAVRMTAAKHTDDVLVELQEAIDAEKRESSLPLRLSMTQQFHTILLTASGNQLLGVLTPPILRVIHSRFREQIPTSSAWPSNIDGDHELILAKIRDGDAEGAAEAMREHLQRISSVVIGPS